MMNFIRMLRIGQWTKNLFLFLPLFFSGSLFVSDKLIHTALGFILFCLTASSVYIINDLRDKEQDRQHPEKRNRPIASGKISGTAAIISCICLISISLGGAFYLNQDFFYILGSYFVMNLAYSIFLKQVSVVDVAIIAAGFTFRVLAGGSLAEVYVSHWIIIMTYLLALFLGFAKRRDDVLLLNSEGKTMRKAVSGYNLEFINAAMTLMAAVVVVAYLMYSLSEEVTGRFRTDSLYYTGIFVLLGILRYFQLTFVQQNSGNPTRLLLKDRALQIIILCWIISFYLIIYVNKPV